MELKKTNSSLSQNLLQAIYLIFLFIAFKFILGHFALSSLSTVDIDLVSSGESNVKIYYWSGIGRMGFSEKHSSKKYLVNIGEQRISINMRNRVAKRLRLDFGDGPATIRVNALILHSNFGKTEVWRGGDLAKMLVCGPNTTVQKSSSNVDIIGSGDDTYVLIDKLIGSRNLFLEFVLPAFAAATFLLFFNNFHFRSFPAIADLAGKIPSYGSNISQLDGLRGFAALLVLADHASCPYCKGLGALGVWLFFGLSGFLLSRPFVVQPERSISAKYLQGYFIRRLKRILPMFYFYITIFFLLPGMFHKFLRHFLFIQGDSILWSVPQEMYFYMLLPFIMLMNHYVFGNRHILIVMFLFFISWWANCYLDINIISIYGNGRKLPLWVGNFFIGMAFSYCYFGLRIHRMVTIPTWLISLIGSIVLACILLSSNQVLQSLFNGQQNYTWQYYGVYGLLVSMLLYLVVISDKTILSKIFSWYPLRAIGLVGFSFYLLHVKSLGMIKTVCKQIFDYKIEGLPLFAVAIVATYCFAALTYSYIERPFMRRSMS